MGPHPGAQSLPLFLSSPLSHRGCCEDNAVPNCKLSVCIQSETNALKHPVGNVLCGVKISFKNKAIAHGVPSLGGGVHRCPEGVLKRKRGTEWCSKHCVKVKARGVSIRDGCLQKFALRTEEKLYAAHFTC